MANISTNSDSPSVISASNSTTTPLGIGATFTGGFIEILPYCNITVLCKADSPSAALGVKIEWSADGITVHADDVFTHQGIHGDMWSFGASASYVRVRYINDGIAQGTFTLQTILHINTPKPSSHRVDDEIDSDDDAELVKAVITGKASDGNFYNVQVDDTGHLITTTIAGFGSDFAFGDASITGTTRQIIRRTAYTEQTSNAQRSIVSSSVNDTSAGTGARTLTITYLDSTGAGPFIETITLNGTTPVNTLNTNICFIEQMEILTVGSTLSNVGIISLKAATAGAGVTIGTIAATDNQTFWAHHYIPIDKVCNITGISISHDGTTSNSGGLFSVFGKLIGVANSVERQVTDSLRLYGQSGTISRNYTSAIKIPGPTRLIVYVTPEANFTTIFRSAVDFFEP